LRQGKLQEALVSLTRLRNQAAKHPYILKLLQDTYIALRDWEKLLELLPQLRKHKVLTREATADLESRATAHLLNDMTVQKQIEKLRERWRSLPRTSERDARIVAAYARGLIALGAGSEAENILRTYLRREWNFELVTLYGKTAGTDPTRQLTQAEQWLRERGSSAALLLCLGRLALHNQLWGKARDYFEQSLKLENNPETCAELGRLLARLGQHERSSEYYERGLLAAVEITPRASGSALTIIS
jgi:HemY protein